MKFVQGAGGGSDEFHLNDFALNRRQRKYIVIFAGGSAGAADFFIHRPSDFWSKNPVFCELFGSMWIN